MIVLVNGGQSHAFTQEVDSMFKLRARVFSDRLGWEVKVEREREVDQFDPLCPDYLLQRDASGAVVGCVRMLPTKGPNMLRDIFPQLAGANSVPEDHLVWEASRYCVDHEAASLRSGGIKQATYELFAGMVEYGFYRGLTDIVAVTDVRMEKILARAGWVLQRLADPMQVGVTKAVAGFLPVDGKVLETIRDRGNLQGPVLWAPVHQEAA